MLLARTPTEPVHKSFAQLQLRELTCSSSMCDNVGVRVYFNTRGERRRG